MDNSFAIDIISGILIITGIACIFMGDKKIKIRGGRIIKIFTWPEKQSRILKWPIGLGLIYSAAMIITKTH